MRLFLRLLAIISAFQEILQFCIFRGKDCESGSPGCIPFIRDINNPDDIKPEVYDLPEELRGICPNYDNTPTCCNKFTMIALQVNLQKVDLTFGNNQTGCSLCAANLKRFYCKYNCDPNQSDFIIPGSSFAFNYLVNPEDPSTERLVVTSNITLDPKTTCAIFQSCQNVDFTKALGSMSTHQGLFNTLSSQAVTQGNVLMNFTYVSNSTALKIPTNNCSELSTNGTDRFNYSLYQQGWCNCQHCAQNCTPRSDWNQYIKQNSILDGLSWRNVITSGVVASILAILGISLRVIARNGKKDNEGQGYDRDNRYSAVE